VQNPAISSSCVSAFYFVYTYSLFSLPCFVQYLGAWCMYGLVGSGWYWMGYNEKEMSKGSISIMREKIGPGRLDVVISGRLGEEH